VRAGEAAVRKWINEWKKRDEEEGRSKKMTSPASSQADLQQSRSPAVCFS
jgi:hypothetical protein